MKHVTVSTDTDQLLANAVYAEIADAMRLIAYGLMLAAAYCLGYAAGMA